MLKLVCFAFALTAGGDYEKVPLGTFYDVYAANQTIGRNLDKYSERAPDCDEYVLDEASKEWKRKERFRADRVRVITGYENSRALLPGEFRIRYRFTINKE